MPVLPSAAPLDTKSSRAVRLAAASPVPEGESTVSGRVETEDGRPVSGVEVHATGYSVYQDSRTDPQGRFRFSAEEGTKVTISAMHSAFGKGERELTAPAKDVLLRLTSEAGAEIHVEMDGRPVSGGQVNLIREPVFYPADELTDAQGTVRILTAPPGQWEVLAFDKAQTWRARSTIDVVRNRVTRVNLRAERLGTIRGIVIGATGQPVPGAQVSAQGGGSAVSGPGGEFDLVGLESDRLYEIDAQTTNARTSRATEVRTGSRGVRLILDALPRFQGRVVGVNGLPLRRFTVGSKEIEDEEGRFDFATTSDDGKVSFSFYAPGHIPRVVTVESDRKQLGDVVLDEAPWVIGRVVDEHGSPVARALVDGPSAVLSAADGTFRIPQGESVRRNAFTLRAVKGSLAGEAEVKPGVPSDIVVHSPKPLRGRVFGQDGRPLDGGFVRLEGTQKYFWPIGSNGDFQGNAVDGVYEIWIEGDGSRRWYVAVPLAGELTLGPSPGTSALEVDLAFEADSLWIAAGAPNVAEHPWGPPAAGQKVYRPERRTLFVGLSPGTYTLVAHSWSGGEDGDLVIQRRIQVPAPGSVRLER
jgi:protocatechuate 3,4-dioxygenase beta subunit